MIKNQCFFVANIPKRVRIIKKRFNEELNKRYGTNAHILDIAIHNDEATPRAHIRFICDYIDKDGIKKICTDKALKKLGIKPPKATYNTDS